MKKPLFMAALLGISAMVASHVFAENIADPGIQRMIATQQKRIERGIQAGDLTSDEAKILQDNLQWIKDKEAGFKSDGRLTVPEKEQIIDMLETNSKMITNKRTNPVKTMKKSEQAQTTFKTAGVPVIERIASQQKRIDESVFSGELTLAEAKILQDNLNQIKSEEEKFRADNKLTPDETAKLQEKLELNSRMIQDKKNNPVRRF